MLWFFERGDERLQCEIRHAAEGTGFELAWTSPEGQIHIQHSEDLAALTERRRELQQRLELDGWKQVGQTPPVRFL
jgi:hypothetical protein